MEIEILTQFKQQLLTFFEELIGQFPEEGDLVIIHLFLSNQIPIQKAMDLFIEKINANNQELKKMIVGRNEAFFLEHNLFDKLGEEKVIHFKKIWSSGKLDADDKQTIWKWIDAFVYLSDRYIKATSA